uniref:Uncharacterized protein n=1 Tax=Skeletonema marinoi TaxID=267567 RepID=A0A7S2Q3P7_9STRA|mmetsp:Transcript_15066/g.30699  ORF Transcript_15066/g.30699 Transcript_15066/m.30699 type:complete len:306 (-) Transcript_15066:120-1037(-)|eukprot:CAMPEP_0113379676 /NCGR_PEP_ID=MMETSP0013_2-20120614/4351_1 /TAXON_ID=2843 ORGANISM="Skeletonema costatum, Strain 1716" /NCGR_SAMPLE_ID=MMETSP0013_2 /ASSEMBLY_ACC=CAM_ASM_000158 /LENGTH=305 /DNA_ID=CAMNT_0000261963 /DNA_START=52 /DNA_END=969 /DNA_ORIENTATION=+ /assembly_acc=CAM_ASM_000158
MRSFLSGIIDCVALPSTSDSPVRVLRKRTSTGTSLGTEATEPSSPLDASMNLDASAHSSMSSVLPNAIESEIGILPIKSVLTAEGIIDDTDDDVGPNPGVDDDEEEDFFSFGIGSSRSYRSIDDGTAKIFEEAFTEFLWNNPAFSSMSYTTLTRLREKLLVQSARNAKVEAELRMQLEQMKEDNRRSELLLQKELLGESNTKSLREAELLRHIQESRDDRADVVGRYHSSLLTNPTGNRVSPSYVGYSPMDARYPRVMPSPHHWQVSYEEETYQGGIRKSKMEQAHMIAEMQKMKQEKMKKEFQV